MSLGRPGGRDAFTAVELLVTIAIVAGLAGLLMPAVQAARESARSLMCQSHLRQIALAVALHVDSLGVLPPARGEASSGPAAFPTWLWTIGPYLDEHRGAAWPPGSRYDDLAEAVRATPVAAFLCPSRRDAVSAVSETSTGPPRAGPCGCILPGATVLAGAVSDYAGNQGDPSPGDHFFKGGHGTGTIVGSRLASAANGPLDLVRVRDIRDGLAATLLVGEAHVRREHLLQLPDTGPAYDGSQFQFTARVGGPGVALGAGPDDDGGGTGWMGFGSWHPAGCHVAFADGHVGRLSTDVAPAVLGSLCHRADATQ
jgi:prepilin-type processing-associated H-X9-DG protein